MTEIQDIVIDPAISGVHFQCNLDQCKGACCTLPGGKGAPLLDHEVEEIHRAFPEVKEYLSERHLEVIREQGMFEGEAGSLFTTCVDNAACVFVTYDHGVARCSLEKAFHAGKTSWKKPLSCHLFPLRIDRGLQERVRYEILEHCRPALDEGKRAGVSLAEFSEEALTRAYGRSWYRRFLDHCRSQNGNGDTEGNGPWQP